MWGEGGHPCLTFMLGIQIYIINKLFGLMHDFRTIPTANMTYTRSQTCTNMMVGKHEIQTFKVVVVVSLLLRLLLVVLASTSAHPFYFIFSQVVCPNIL